MEEHENTYEEKLHEELADKQGKFKMDKRVILWIIIALLAIGVIYVVFFKDTSTAQAIASSGQAARSSSGMVGGC